MVAVAIAGAAVVGAGASLAGSSSAADAATNASNNNNALQAEIYDQNKTALAPYEAQGTGATSAINGLLGINGGDAAASTTAYNTYQGSDEYQNRLAQGQKSVQAALGAKGLLDSGAAQKSLLNYGQTAASDEFSKYMANLTGQQGVGLTAASAQAGVGQNYANATSANNNDAATATGNAALSGASAVNSALGSGLTAYTLNQGLNSAYNSGGSGAYGVSGSDGIY